MVVGSGTVLCPRCKISGTTVKAWNVFMEPTDISELISTVSRPLYVLKAIAVYTTDKGLKGLAATTLKSLDQLDFSEFISDKEEAAKLQKELAALSA